MDLSSRAISQERAKEDCNLIKLMRTRKINIWGMKCREGISLRVFEYSTENSYLNAFEDSLNLVYQGQNDCKMSEKLKNLHNTVVSKIFLKPCHNLDFTQLNKTWMDSHLVSPLDLTHKLEVLRLLMNATVDGIPSLQVFERIITSSSWHSELLLWAAEAPSLSPVLKEISLVNSPKLYSEYSRAESAVAFHHTTRLQLPANNDGCSLVCFIVRLNS